MAVGIGHVDVAPDVDLEAVLLGAESGLILYPGAGARAASPTSARAGRPAQLPCLAFPATSTRGARQPASAAALPRNSCPLCRGLLAFEADLHAIEGGAVGYGGKPKSTQFGLKSLRLARKLEPGFVLTIEPGIYFIPALIAQWREAGRFSEHIRFDRLESYLDFGGVRIEDDVLITDAGARVLGPPIPKKIAEVEAACA